MATKTTYTTTGSVRGNCGHTHRTLSGAIRCLSADRTGCERQGGYSDREIVASDGRDLVEDEALAAWRVAWGAVIG